jgi:hypothetical protein
MATRQPVKPLNQSAESIRANAAAEKARKAASKRALKAAQTESADEQPVSTQADPALEQMALDAAKARVAQDAANALATAKADAEATGRTLEQMLDEMGIDAEGHPVGLDDKTRYQGPMLALVAARKNYTKAANGVLCNGDQLALICGKHSREATVAALIIALKLPGNPYLALNPGQQSMNLRNKARNALKNGALTYAEIEAAYAAA